MRNLAAKTFVSNIIINTKKTGYWSSYQDKATKTTLITQSHVNHKNTITVTSTVSYLHQTQSSRILQIHVQ
jgi:hypothetical protein